MKLFRHIMGVVTALALAVNLALAQSYPTSTPVYIPSAVLAAQTFTAAGTATFQINGQGTVFIRVAGTNTSLSALVQTTEARAGTPVWSNVAVDKVGGGRLTTIVGQGLYRLNASGAAQLRFNLASLVGTNVTVTMNGSPGIQSISQIPVVRQTFGTSFAVTPVANATDFYTLIGPGSPKVARVTQAECTGTSTLASQGLLVAIKRSTPTTAGTSAAATITAYDSGSDTPGAVATLFTANGTLGTSLGALRRAVMATVLSTGGVNVNPTKFTFGQFPGEQEVVLRSASETFALNADNVGFSSGAVLQCAVTWTEE